MLLGHLHYTHRRKSNVNPFEYIWITTRLQFTWCVYACVRACMLVVESFTLHGDSVYISSVSFCCWIFPYKCHTASERKRKNKQMYVYKYTWHLYLQCVDTLIIFTDKNAKYNFSIWHWMLKRNEDFAIDIIILQK